MTDPSEKPRRVEGSIEWRGRQSYRIRVANGIDPKTGRRRYLFTTGKGNAKAAEKALRELLTQRDAGLGVNPKRVTAEEWIGAWLENRIADGAIGPRAAENYRTILCKRIAPAFAGTKLTDVRSDQVIAFKAALVDEDLAPATVGKILGIVKQGFEAAVVSGLIVRNPSQGIARPSVGGPSTRERRALREVEIAKLLAAAEGTPLATAIRIALATGMRQSELLGLRWSDIDLERGQLVVQQTIQHVAGDFQSLPPKTRNSRRAIELSSATAALLRRHKSTQNEDRLRLGSVWRDNDLVLPAPDGAPQYRRIFYRDYMRLVRAAGIDDLDGLNFHSLRHSAASLWIRAGVDIFTVSRRLGHSKTSFTMDVYAHLLDGQQRGAAEALDHLLAQ